MLSYLPYCCPKCDTPFDTLSDLRKHLVANHPGSSVLDSEVKQHQSNSSHRGTARQPLLADKQTEDPHAYVIGWLWNQVSNMKRLTERTRERHKVERESLQQNMQIMTNELLAAEQIIQLLTSERQRLMADCRQLTQQYGIQKETSENFKKQLEEKSSLVAEKDKELTRLNDFIHSTTEKQLTAIKIVEDMVPKFSEASENKMKYSPNQQTGRKQLSSNEPPANSNTSHSDRVSSHNDKQETTLNFRDPKVKLNESRSHHQSSSSSSTSAAAKTTVPLADDWQQTPVKQKRQLPDISVGRDWLVQTSGGQYTINDHYAQHGEAMPSSNIGLRRVSSASDRDYHDDQWPTLWT